MTRWHVRLIAAGTALVASSLGACSVDERGPRATPTVTPIAPIARGSEYVAIGDSYTAAPKTGPLAANDGCLQSTLNYPHRVAQALELELTDVSCGAASTEHVTHPQTLDGTQRPPQADALSSTTDLVTVSLGANDFTVFESVVLGCTSIRVKDPAGAPCASNDASGGASRVEDTINRIEERLTEAIGDIADRAPNARIIVIGYPEFFPASGPCAQLPLASGDFAFARRFNELIVRAQERAAQRADVEYVDVFGPSSGHHMCAAEPWIAGLTPTRTDGMFYHPYPEEQELVTDLLVDLLR